MSVSVVNPLSPAIELTKRILFQPFDLGKWFVLGFCAWLAHLGEGGGGNFNFPTGNFGGGGGGGTRTSSGPRTGPVRTQPAPEPEFQQVLNWIQDHLLLIGILLIAALLLMIVLMAVMTWLSSRGQFMFLDGVVRNRAAVKEPWREYAAQGNSLFWFRFWFGLLSMVLLLGAIALGVGIAWTDIKAERFQSAALLGILVGLSCFILVAIVDGCVGLFLRDFVVPVMYLQHQTVIPAWGVFFSTLASGRWGTMVLYVLFKMVISFAVAILAGIVGLLACCVTLGIAILPYLSTVVILPFLVFNRAFSLYFLEQFGPEWQFFRRETDPFRDDFNDPSFSPARY